MVDDPAEIAQISVYLGKEQVTFDTIIDPNSGLAQKPGLRSFNFEVDGFQCRFYYFEKVSAKDTPPWLEFVSEQASPGDPLKFQGTSRSPNGLLLLSMKNRTFAAAFGRSAASCLLMKAVEPDFGIKTAMNMCGNEELRQTKTQSTAAAVAHIDRQLSKPSEAFVFGLSEAEDLKYISAQLKGEKNVTLQGRDNLTIKVIGDEKLTWARLIKRCDDFLTKYKSKDYEKLFPNYRNFRAANDLEIARLDDLLIQALKDRGFEKLQLAVPEFLADDEFSFSYTNYDKKENQIYAYLDLAQLDVHLKLDDVTIKRLDDRRIYAYSAIENRILDHKWWSLYSALIFEAKLGQKYFILNGGQWSQVDPAFYSSIQDFIKNTVREERPQRLYLNIDITDAAAKKNLEAVFNAEVVKRRPTAILFDKAKLRIGAGRKDKEFCDVLDMEDDGVIRIINAKPYKDGTSIVYLFSQAKFYCDAFISDETFLADIRDYIANCPSAWKAKYLAYIKPNQEENIGSNYRLCLWLLYDKTQTKPEKENIPLIAQYELKLMHDHLRRKCKFQDVILRFIPVKRTQFRTSRAP